MDPERRELPSHQGEMVSQSRKINEAREQASENCGKPTPRPTNDGLSRWKDLFFEECLLASSRPRGSPTEDFLMDDDTTS